MPLRGRCLTHRPPSEPWLLTLIPEKAFRLEPVLLFRRKQSASSFLVSCWLLLLFLNIADGFRRCGDHQRHSDIGDHRKRLKLIWSFSEAADSMVRQGGIQAHVAA